MTRPTTEQGCGYAIEDEDGNQEPCDRPATGWRWYQDVGDHEDMLDVACDWHANEGGQRIHDADLLRASIETIAETKPGATGRALRSALDANRTHDSTEASP